MRECHHFLIACILYTYIFVDVNIHTDETETQRINMKAHILIVVGDSYDQREAVLLELAKGTYVYLYAQFHTHLPVDRFI